MMTDLCDRRPTRLAASAREQLGQRQAAHRQAADLEERAPRDAVAIAVPRAEERQHRPASVANFR